MDHWTTSNADYAPPKAGEPPLHRAAREGDAEAIRRLASAGEDLDAAFDIGLDPGARARPATSLMVAAGSGDGASAETVSLLLELGADPKITLGDASAATFACTGLGWNYRPGGDVQRLQLLLDAGSPLPEHPEALNGLVCRVAELGDPDRLRVLLSLGASAQGHFDEDLARARAEAMRRMTEEEHSETDDGPLASVSPGLRAELEESLRQEEERLFELECSAPSAFQIPLFQAAESGNVECVRLLLREGCDPLTRDSARRTAMYYVGSAEIARELLAAGVPLQDSDDYEWPPLVAALKDEEVSVPRARALIEVGADVNATHDHGYTVFMSALGMGRTPELIRLVVDAGADPHAVSEHGWNAFHAAIDAVCESCDEESVRDTLSYLKALGVDIEHRNKIGQTPLARAVMEGNGIEVRTLCELGADPNVLCPEYHGCADGECTSVDTPLIFHAVGRYCYEGDVKTEALLRAGVDPTAKDQGGHTPLQRALSYLCAESDDYEGSFRSFIEGLGELLLEDGVVPGARDDFISAALPQIRKYVDGFGDGIVIRRRDEFAEKDRRERLATIALLCAYEGWARHEQLRQSRD